MKTVSIITVNFNQPLVTEQLLQSIFTQNTYNPLEIIVVDNGSTQDPVPAWKEKYPAVQFIRSEVNLGFAGGNNLGIQLAKGQYYFLVNNDTEFTEGLVPKLVSVLDEHPEVAVVSPRIRFYYEPDVIQYAGFTEMDYKTGRNKRIGEYEKDTGQYDAFTGPTAFADGAAFMIRREAADKAGLMAENFFLYYEEMDWCERIKRAGYTIWINQQALIYHKESVAVGKKSALKEYYMNRNRILFIRKNAPTAKRCIFYLYFMLVVTPRNVISYIKNGNVNFIGVLFRAILWNCMNSTNSSYRGYP